MAKAWISLCLGFLLCCDVAAVVPVAIRIQSDHLQDAKDVQQVSKRRLAGRTEGHIMRRQLPTVPKEFVEQSHVAQHSSLSGCPIYDSSGACSPKTNPNCPYLTGDYKCNLDESTNPCGCVPSYYTCTCTATTSATHWCHDTSDCPTGELCADSGRCMAQGPKNYAEAYEETVKFETMEAYAEQKAGVRTTAEPDNLERKKEDEDEDELIKDEVVGIICLIGICAVCGVGGVVVSKRRAEMQLELLKHQMKGQYADHQPQTQAQHAGQYDPNMQRQHDPGDDPNAHGHHDASQAAAAPTLAPAATPEEAAPEAADAPTLAPAATPEAATPEAQQQEPPIAGSFG